MTDLAELAEVFDLRCYRCGKAGADVFERPAELHAFLHPEPLTSEARRLERPVQLRTIRVEDVERAGLPVHRRCRPGWRPPDRPEPRRAPYDLDRSVALWPVTWMRWPVIWVSSRGTCGRPVMRICGGRF